MARQREVSNEANFWRKISLNPTIDFLEQYMKLYPLGKGKFYEKAEIELDKIKYSDLANIEWEKAKKEDTKKAYISFYEVYSYHHNLAVQALKKIKLFDKREKKKEDTIAWEKAILEFTKESFIEYLQNFPRGKYIDKAKKIIESFQNRHLKTNIIGDFDYYIEVMEFVNSLQNVSYQRVEKHEANVYDVFYTSSMEILKKIPNIVIYLLMCESIYKDFHTNKIKSEFMK